MVDTDSFIKTWILLLVIDSWIFVDYLGKNTDIDLVYDKK